MKIYLNAPTFADPDKTERAKTLFHGVWLITIGIFLFAGIQVGATGDWSRFSLRTLPIALTLIPIALGSLELNRRGYDRAAGWLFVCGYIALTCLRAPLSGGVRAPSVVMFPLMTMFAGMILGRAAGLWIAACCGMVAGALVIAELSGVAEIREVHYPPIVFLGALCLYMSVTLFLLRIAISRSSRALGVAQDELVARRAVERRLSVSLAAGEIGTFEVDLSDDWIFADAQAHRLWGLPEAGGRLSRTAVQSAIHPEDFGALTAAVQTLRDSGEHFRVEYRIVRADGEVRYLETTAAKFFDDTVKRPMLVGTLNDVTARKGAELELRRLSERLELATQAASIGIWDWHVGRNDLVWDDTMCRLYGIPAGSFDGTFEGWTKRLHPEDVDRETARIRSALAGQKEFVANFRILRPDGSIRYIRALSHTIRRPDGGAVRMVGVNFDVTERTLAQQKLQDSERKLSAVFEHSITGIALLDGEGGFVTCNPALQAILGHDESELRGRRLADFRHPADDGEGLRLYNELAAGQRDRFELEKQYLRADGKSVWCHVSTSASRDSAGRVENAVVVLIDISERKEAEQKRKSLEAELQAAEKMRSMGTLAGGIAHDFNNILGGILGFSQILENDLRDLPVEQHLARRITNSAERGRTIVEQILSFARGGVHERKIIELSRFLREVEPLLESLTVPNVPVKIACRDTDLYTKANAGQMTQVMSNLCKNASQAYEGRDGAVTISLFRMPGPVAMELFAGSERSVVNTIGKVSAETDYACIRVSDTGIGIQPAALKRIFEPFYTTNDRRGGTGLGLAVVQAAIEANGAGCVVESDAWEGTRFSLLLPLAAPEQDGVRQAEDRAPDAMAPIMVVDDEVDIADGLVAGLSRRGLEATGFTNANAALAAFREKPGHWGIVITDQLMLDARGSDVARAMKELDPGVVVVLYSGLYDAIPGDDDLFDLRLSKPQRIEQIVGALSKFLASKPARD